MAFSRSYNYDGNSPTNGVQSTLNYKTPMQKLAEKLKEQNEKTENSIAA
jgi:hypothetical protein